MKRPRVVEARLAAVLAAAGLAGCAGSPTANTLQRAKIVNASPARAITGVEARYDRGTGTCNARSIQLLPSDEVDALIVGWKEPPEGCEGPTKQALPDHGDYPRTAARTRKPGSAHVLVRLQADGQVDAVKAVCATDASYAEAAVETVARIRFSPMVCAGTPTRVAFFIPLDYVYR